MKRKRKGGRKTKEEDESSMGDSDYSSYDGDEDHTELSGDNHVN